MTRYAHLDDDGALAGPGRAYSGVSQDGKAEAGDFLRRMTDSEAGMRGAAASELHTAAEMASGNLNRLAAMIAAYALGTVRAERELTAAEAESAASLRTAQGSLDAPASSLDRSIEA